MLIVDDACGIGACCFFLNKDAIPAIAATPARIGNNGLAAAAGANAALVVAAVVVAAVVTTGAAFLPNFNKPKAAPNIPPPPVFLLSVKM